MTTQIERTDVIDAEVMMDAAEARECLELIRRHLGTWRALILELYQREGWKALGYASWRECVVAEFGESQSYLYRQLQAALIELEISPIGEIGTMPESHARELEKAPEGERGTVLEQAVEKLGPGQKLTAAHLAQTVQAYVAKGTRVWWRDERTGIRTGQVLAPYANGYMIQLTVGPDVCLPRESFTIGEPPDERLCARCGGPAGLPSHNESDGWVCVTCFGAAAGARSLPALPAPEAEADEAPVVDRPSPPPAVPTGKAAPAPELTPEQAAAKARREDAERRDAAWRAVRQARYELLCEAAWEEISRAGDPDDGNRETPILDGTLRTYAGDVRIVEEGDLVAVGLLEPSSEAADEDLYCARCEQVIPAEIVARFEDGLVVEAENGIGRDASGVFVNAQGAMYCDACAPGVAVCRQCGCTDEAGCDGGCSWVAADLCSACGSAEEPEPAAAVTAEPSEDGPAPEPAVPDLMAQAVAFVSADIATQAGPLPQEEYRAFLDATVGNLRGEVIRRQAALNRRAKKTAAAAPPPPDPPDDAPGATAESTDAAGTVTATWSALCALPFPVGAHLAWIDPTSFRRMEGWLEAYDPETDLATVENRITETATHFSAAKLAAACVPTDRGQDPPPPSEAAAVAQKAKPKSIAEAGAEGQLWAVGQRVAWLHAWGSAPVRERAGEVVKVLAHRLQVKADDGGMPEWFAANTKLLRRAEG